MSKNVIHDINIIIENNTDSKNSEQLSKDFLEQIALVIKEASEQKDTEQLMQEQQTITATAENTSTPTGEGAIASSKGQSATPSTAKSTTSSASGETTTTFSAPTGGGVTDNSEKPAMSLNASENTTPSVSEAENVGTDSFSGTTSETYESVASQQSVMVPQSIQQKRANGPSLELVKAEIKMKLHKAVVANDVEGIKEWTRILKAFSEGATIEDFYGKPNETLFTQMYDDLCKLNDVTQTFDWTVISKKMIEAIDAKILNGEITASGKKHWLEIKRQLKDEKTNIANLFEQYDELFLLLKEVEGLERLPGRITITTKTKVYPNLSADIVYADIGTESVYSFLKKVKNAEIQGAGVNKGAVKVKNSDATSFIVGESLDFVIDEVFVNQSLYSKENINWVVYKDNKMVGAPFVNEGLTFSYNFDKPGAYKIEAYGGKSGAAGGVVSSKLSKKKKAALKDANIAASAFVELRIVAQEIVITPPSSIYKGEKGKNDFARPFTAEKDFVISLKNNDVRSLNPITLYYQTSYTKVGGPIVKSEVKPLDTSGVIKMAMPELGAYSLEVFSKDQYGLTQSSSISILRNYVKDIEIIQGKKEYLMQNKERTMVLKAKSFKINPATEDEKANVKWVVYAKNGEKWDSYTPPGNAEPKGEKFDFSVPKKAGEYFIEAYNNTRDGLKSISSQKIEVIHPVVTEATWAFRSGSKKTTSGFGGESNWIKATIPHFANQKVRVLFFVNTEKEECYYSDTTTNEAGEIDKFIAFDDKFKTRFGLQKGGTAKITFKLVGIVDGQIYTFKGAKYPKSNAVISVSSEEKILDLYFTYNGVRVTAQDRIPFGVKDPSPLSIVAKTQNMIGKEIAFTSHRLGGKSILGKLSKRKIDNAGVATVSYSIPEKKNLKKGETETYYAGIEGYSTKHIKDKAVVMQAGASEGIFGENDPQLVWGTKVSKDFRIEVYQICKRLWPKNSMAMANGLMTVMAAETYNTFYPHMLSGKLRNVPSNASGYSERDYWYYNDEKQKVTRAVGLIQFTKAPMIELGLISSEVSFEELLKAKIKLSKMTVLNQLKLVEKYLLLFDIYKKAKVPKDIYTLIFHPADIGKGYDATIIGKKSDSYGVNSGLDKNDNGIQLGELVDVRYGDKYEEGKLFINKKSGGQVTNSGQTTKATWMETVWKEEAKGLIETGSNEEIQKYFDGTPYEKAMKNNTNSEKNVAWCAAFVNWIMKKNGYNGVTTDKGYDAVRALKWATWAEGVDLKKPVYGAIAVKSRKGGGHVGFVAGKKGNKIVIVGGNQGQQLMCATYSESDYFAYLVPKNFLVEEKDYNLPEYLGNPKDKSTES